MHYVGPGTTPHLGTNALTVTSLLPELPCVLSTSGVLLVLWIERSINPGSFLIVVARGRKAFSIGTSYFNELTRRDKVWVFPNTGALFLLCEYFPGHGHPDNSSRKQRVRADTDTVGSIQGIGPASGRTRDGGGVDDASSITSRCGYEPNTRLEMPVS